ncbi:FAD binding domain-containing protein [Micromonospora pisi]|uniref:FAD binding domain-containing protein n=1 Tax=Micromonospora pisi TaxID=589240 RepID=A0A495JG87_9ACTN|nr:FAD-dependent oxidoreductase [Micromonospora pisi]RKR87815.1 FAD binding domain-containing protein [Micromonospora pisi]
MSRLSSVPEQLRGRIVGPDDARYPLLRSTYTRSFQPAAVLLPESTEEVVAALRFARDQGLAVAVRSGGHGLAGDSANNGGVVIDLSAMDRVELIDRASRLVRVEAGARWGTVARSLAPYGLAISSGDHGNVGVGGLTTGGGVGWLVRQYGLTIDHVRAVELVLADGTTVRADADHEPELFWAVRGAGAGLGIVVAFEIEAIELTDVGYAQVVLEADRRGDTLRRWSEYLATAPRELSTAMSVVPYGTGSAVVVQAVVASADTGLIRAAVAPLLKIGVNLLEQRIQLAPYTALVSTAHLHPNTGQQSVLTTNGLLPTLTAETAGAVMAVASGREQMLLQLRSVGGAVNDVAPDATAYAHRHQQALVVGTIFPAQRGAELDVAWQPLAGHLDGAYVNFESRPDPAAFARIYPGATGERVLATRKRYDPDAVFRTRST